MKNESINVEVGKYEHGRKQSSIVLKPDGRDGLG